MSQSVLNRTSSYVSCYSAVATNTPLSSINRHGSIESLLHGHSKCNPGHVRVIVRKNFEPFAQAHLAVSKGERRNLQEYRSVIICRLMLITLGSIVTALFARGPWLYIRTEPDGQTGYIPRIICSLYRTRSIVSEKNYYRPHHLSMSSTDSSSNKDDELDLTVVTNDHEKYFIRPYQQQKKINRYLSHSSAMINEQTSSYQAAPKKSQLGLKVDEHHRRNTCALSGTSSIPLPKERRLTVNNVPLQASDVTVNHVSIVTRDTDSSSTQDSGYSESTPYFVVQQTTPDSEQATNSKVGKACRNVARLLP
jgi:hypothetical protein